MNISEILRDAVVLHQRGEVRQAEVVYRRILDFDPDCAPAHANLGAILLDQQQAPAALAELERAVALDEANAIALNNRGSALLRLGRAEEALGSYRHAIQLEPGYANAHSNCAGALLALQRPDEALLAAERALALQPDLPTALNNRGSALTELGRSDEALACFNRVLGTQPRWSLALANRSAALLSLGRTEEALRDAEQALALEPQSPVALNNCGNALRALQRFRAAAASYQQAAALQPDFLLAHLNLGNVLLDLERPELALVSFDAAARLRPAIAHPQLGRATALLQLRRFSEAAAAFVRTHELRPDLPYALGLGSHCLAQSTDWLRHEELGRRIVEGVRRGERVDEPGSFLALTDSAADQAQCARSYSSDRFPAVAPLAPPVEPAAGRVHIGYLSGDLRDHPVSYLMAGVFEQHDRSRFEVTALSFRPPGESGFARRVAGAFDRFVEVGERSDAEAAGLMRDLKIDIAVDLMGFTRGTRLGILARRPAPVQVHYLGYPGTLGVPYIDYTLADEFVIPQACRVHYAEQIAYLPDCFQANDDRRIIGPVPTRAEAGLPERGLVLCSFSNSFKLNPASFDIWCRLLARCPDSVLWILAGYPGIPRHLRLEAGARGIAPERLIFAERVPYPDHLARLGLADLFLDTFPFNAGATASDALWAGVPLLTHAGEAFAARMAGSLLHAVGLPELVTSSAAEYERIATELMLHPDRLAGVRRHLAASRERTALFDTRRFTRNLESAYATMHAAARRGERPASFAVSPGAGG